MGCCIFATLAEYGALAVVALYLGSYVWEWLWPFVLSKFTKTRDIRTFGDWAVVTGATDGIGKAFAKILSKEYGFNLVLISRNEDRLNAAAEEIKNECGSGKIVKTIAMDFSTTDLTQYEKIKTVLGNLDIAVLVNNVGVAYEYPEYFDRFPGGIEGMQQMIQVNCCAGTVLSHMVLPKMLEKKKGAILNLSSASGIFPTPLNSVYSGTKAYVDFLSKSLQAEYNDSGVVIQCISPFFVTTKMSKIRNPSFFVPDQIRYARSALSLIGVQDNTVGYFAHGLQLFVLRLLPQWLITKQALAMMKGTRIRALKKKEKSG